MGARVERFPEYGVTLSVFSGIVTAEVLREHFNALGPDDVLRRITYADPTSDMSAVHMASLPELKRDIAVKVKELLGGRRGVSALVTNGKSGKLASDFWSSYVRQDPSYPVQVMAFESLEAACAWLELPEAGCRAVIEAATGRTPRRHAAGFAFADAHHHR